MKMLKSRHLLFTMCVFLFSLTLAFAQSLDSLQTASVMEKSIVITSRLERDLSLTKEQTKQVLEVVTVRFENIEKEKTEKSYTAEQLEKINLEAHKKLANILTKQQTALYQELRQQTKKQKEDYIKKSPKYTFSEQDKEMDF